MLTNQHGNKLSLTVMIKNFKNMEKKRKRKKAWGLQLRFSFVQLTLSKKTSKKSIRSNFPQSSLVNFKKADTLKVSKKIAREATLKKKRIAITMDDRVRFSRRIQFLLLAWLRRSRSGKLQFRRNLIHFPR